MEVVSLVWKIKIITLSLYSNGGLNIPVQPNFPLFLYLASRTLDFNAYHALKYHALKFRAHKRIVK